MDAGLLILRVFAGLSLALAHGLGKLPPSDRFIAGAAEMGFPLPALFAWAAALPESLGRATVVVSGERFAASAPAEPSTGKVPAIPMVTP